MTRALVVLALTLMSGCAMCKRHEVACIAVASVIVMSVPLMVHGHNQTTGNPPPYELPMSIPLTPDCAKYSELCK